MSGFMKDVLNVFHFRDNDMADLLRVEHRVFLAKRRGDRGRGSAKYSLPNGDHEACIGQPGGGAAIVSGAA